MSQEPQRDLEADLKIVTAIEPDPDEPNFVSDVVAPHALRRAIAAEAALTKVRKERDEARKEAEALWKEMQKVPEYDTTQGEGGNETQ